MNRIKVGDRVYNKVKRKDSDFHDHGNVKRIYYNKVAKCLMAEVEWLPIYEDSKFTSTVPMFRLTRDKYFPFKVGDKVTLVGGLFKGRPARILEITDPDDYPNGIYRRCRLQFLDDEGGYARYTARSLKLIE